MFDDGVSMHHSRVQTGSLRPTPGLAMSALQGPWAMSENGVTGMRALLMGGLTGHGEAMLRAEDMERVAARAVHAKSSQLWEIDDDWFDPTVDAHVRPSGVGVLPIDGALMTKGWWCWKGYDQITAAGREMLERYGDALKAIVLRVNSPGGACAGAHELAAEIRGWRSQVPVFAVVDHDVCSAAAWLALQADYVYLSPSGTLGHLGIWTDWFDMTGWLKKEGYRHGFISEGEYKTFFSGDDTEIDPAEQDRKRLEVMRPIVQGYYRLMMDDVAAGRGARLTRDAAVATGAMIYMGQAAIDAGLADRLASFEDVIEALEMPAPMEEADGSEQAA